MITGSRASQPVSASEPVVLTWLYVPGDRPDRFDKACASGADVVVIDWEDAVVAANKAAAREHTRQWLAGRATSTPIEVRVNPVGSAEFSADAAALAECVGVLTIRLAKVESAAQVEAAALALPAGSGLVCVLESAAGVEQAYAIACAARVVRIGLGEADLQADLGVRGEAQLEWCRARVVVAARAAGLPSPAMSVYRAIEDLDGLRESSLGGRDAGMLGRAAVHPRQVAVIRDAFRPGDDEIAAAGMVIAAAAEAGVDGRGGFVDGAGRFVDVAVVRNALRVEALARLTQPQPGPAAPPPPTPQ
jgi:citrate lyase subunit beta/citryl-CoA lyase